jgi:hypothetical protein
LGIVATLAVAALFYWQFFQDDAALAAMRRQNELVGGSFWWGIAQVTGLDVADLVTVGRAGVVLWVASCCLCLWRRPEPRQAVRAAASSLLLLAVFGASLFGSWYHVWWLPFALLLGEGYLFRVAAIVSFTAPLGYLGWAAFRSYAEPAQWWGIGCDLLPFAVAPWIGPRSTSAR